MSKEVLRKRSSATLRSNFAHELGTVPVRKVLLAPVLASLFDPRALRSAWSAKTAKSPSWLDSDWLIDLAFELFFVKLEKLYYLGYQRWR